MGYGKEHEQAGKSEVVISSDAATPACDCEFSGYVEKISKLLISDFGNRLLDQEHTTQQMLSDFAHAFLLVDTDLKILAKSDKTVLDVNLPPDIDTIDPDYYAQLASIYFGRPATFDETILGRALKGEQTNDIEIDVRLHDGSARKVVFSAIPIKDEDNNVKMALMTARFHPNGISPVAEQSENDAAVFFDTFYASNIGTFILDADFKVVWINQALERYFGIEKNSVIGRDKRRLINTEFKFIFENPDEFESKVLATYNNNTYIENFECHVLPNSHRQERWMEHWSRPINKGPFKGGRIEHYTDITQRKTIEQQLSAGESRYKAMIEDQPNLVCRCTPDGVLTFVNEAVCRILGLPREEIIGCHFSSFTSHHLAEEFLACKSIIDRHNQFAIHDPVVTTRDGAVLHMQWTHKGIFDEMGNIVEYQSIGSDISYLRREQELRKSEALYRAVVEEQTDIICRFLPDTTIIFANAAFARHLGVPRNQLCGRRILDLPQNNELRKIHRNLTQLNAEKTTINLDVESVTPDGRARWIHWTIRAIFDTDSDISEIQCVGRDITEMKGLLARSEDALAALDTEPHHWQHLINNMPAGILFMDSELRIIAMNRAYKELFPIDDRYREGMRVDELLPGAEECGITALLRNALETGKTVRVDNFRYDGFSVGTTYWNGSVIPVRIKTENKMLRGLAMVVVDATAETWCRTRLSELAEVSERRAVELEAEKARLDAVLRSVPQPMIVWNRDGKIIACNADMVDLANELGLGGDALIGSSFDASNRSEFLDNSGNLIPKDKMPLARALKGETSKNETVICKTSDGIVRTLNISSAPLKDANGEIEGVVETFQDFTEQARIQEKIQEVYRREHAIAEKLQRSFLPYEFAKINGVDVVQRYIPALDEALVGGDFYDIFRLDSARYGIVIADVSGKGLKAAVYTAMTKYMLRAYALDNPEPSLVLARLNEALSTCTPYEVFVTLVYGVLDCEKHTFTYANAGHEQPIYYSVNSDFAMALDVTGGALALVNGSTYSTHQIETLPGDLIALYTDGITDAGAGHDRFGPDNLVKLIESRCTVSTSQLADVIIATAVDYAGGKLSDDAALLLIKIEEPRDASDTHI